MGLGCGMSMVKYILFVFNLLCALCGIAILAVGVAFYLKIDDFDHVFEDWNVIAVPIIFVAFGSIIFIIAFFGCCGAIRESHCMTSTYSALLMIILIAQIILGIIVFVYIGDIQEASSIVLKKLWDDHDKPANAEFWKTIQTGLQCCGLNGPAGYLPSLPPDSCCSSADRPKEYGTFISKLSCTANVYQTGCAQALNDFVQLAGHTLGAVALGVAAIELIGVIFACCLANNIRNQSRRYS